MRLKKLLGKYWIALFIIAVISLRLPSLFEPFTYGDEGIYLTLGQAARHGMVWYRDIHDNKPPMLYLIATLANGFTTYRLINFFWSLATILAFWQLVRLIFPKNKWAEVLSTTVFAILTSLHSFESNIGNAENFMLLPTIAGFYLIYEALAANSKHSPRRSRGRCLTTIRGVFSLIFFNWIWLLAGFLFGIATLFKIPAAFDFAAALVFLFIFFVSQKIINLTSYIIHHTFLISGFFLPILITFIYYAYHQAFRQYLSIAFLQNLPYLSSWDQGKTQVGGLPLLLIFRVGLVFILIAGLLVFRKRVALPVKCILIWFAFSWFAALLSSRPYPHYLIQIIPAFSLSLGLLFTGKRFSMNKLASPICLAIIFGATFFAFHFWYYPNRSYYLNFYQYALKIKNRQQYFYDFDHQADAIYQTATYLKERTSHSEKIFIWGTIPSIYSLAERLPVGRYTSSYHITDFDGFQPTVVALKKDRPRYILVCLDEKQAFPEFFLFLKNNYLLEKQIGMIQIFHRIIM